MGSGGGGLMYGDRREGSWRLAGDFDIMGLCPLGAVCESGWVGVCLCVWARARVIFPF